MAQSYLAEKKFTWSIIINSRHPHRSSFIDERVPINSVKGHAKVLQVQNDALDLINH